MRPVGQPNGFGAFNGTSNNLDHTVPPGTDRILLVAINTARLSGSPHVTVTSVTFGGVPLTQILHSVENVIATNGNRIHVAWWFLLNPDVGTDTITINYSAGTSVEKGAISISGFSPARRARRSTSRPRNRARTLLSFVAILDSADAEVVAVSNFTKFAVIGYRWRPVCSERSEGHAFSLPKGDVR